MARSRGHCICDGFVAVTEAAALAAAEWIGRGDTLAGDEAAREAMAVHLGELPYRLRVVVSRGGHREAGALRVGDQIGGDGDSLDLAVDPLEGHTALAQGSRGALAMLAAGPAGSIMAVPEMYMEKMIVAGKAAAAIDIDAPVTENVRAVAAALGRRQEDLCVMVLNRARHEELIAQVKRSGARLNLIDDGDASAGLAAAVRGAGVDMYVGIGGSTEGVITAAALRCVGGEIQARFWPVSRHQIEQVRAGGITDVEARLTTEDMAGDGVLFAATAVTGDRFLRGVEVDPDGTRTESMVLCSRCHAVRVVKTIHRQENKGPELYLWTR